MNTGCSAIREDGKGLFYGTPWYGLHCSESLSGIQDFAEASTSACCACLSPAGGALAMCLSLR